MSRERVLALLRERQGEYCSGEAMSRLLGISRAGVWKAIEGLRQEGYVISSAPNRGYRLETSPDLLSAGELSGALAGRLIGRALICLPTVDSTNSEVKRRAAGGAPEGLAVLADGQTGGRGRRGRPFQSMPGKGLYCSVLLRPACPPEELGQLTAWTAVAVCRAIRDCCGAECGIKWTNDLILGGRKVCGILTELELEAESAAALAVVAGIGINVGQTPADFGPELAPAATSLSQELRRPVRRAELAAALLRALDEMYAAFPAGKPEYLAEYRRRCVTTGREVVLLRGKERVTAFAEEIDDRFALVCRLPGGGRETVTAGEVSVRGLLGYV